MRLNFLAIATWLSVFLILAKCDDSNIGTFWFYSDFHVDLEQERLNNTGYWGDYTSDTNMIVAFTGIEIGNDQGYAENAPDFVVWGGNSLREKAPQSKQMLHDVIANLSAHFRNAFSPKEIPIITLIGNYDVYPTDQMSSFDKDRVRIDWCTELSVSKLLWRSWFEYLPPKGLSDVGDNFKKFCYYAWQPRKNLVVFGLNSLLWAVENKLTDGADPLEQFNWLELGLKWARANNIKVILATHHPFGLRDFRTEREFFLQEIYNERLVTIYRKFSDVIITTLAAHQHVDTFKVILNETFYPIGNMFLNPSVSPKNIDGVGQTNPRFRKYFYDRDRGVITDYIQFYLDLSVEAPSWRVEYRATHLYKLKDLSHHEMARLLDEFTEFDNEEERWSRFWTHQLGGRPHATSEFVPDGQCSEARSKCRCKMICAMRHVDRVESLKCYDFCDKNEKPALTTIDQLINPREEPKKDIGPTVGIVIGVILAVALIGINGFAVYRKCRNSS